MPTTTQRALRPRRQRQLNVLTQVVSFPTFIVRLRTCHLHRAPSLAPNLRASANTRARSPGSYNDLSSARLYTNNDITTQWHQQHQLHRPHQSRHQRCPRCHHPHLYLLWQPTRIAKYAQKQQVRDQLVATNVTVGCTIPAPISPKSTYQ